MFPGTGQFVKAAEPEAPTVREDENGIYVNFAGVDLSKVIETILKDLLNLNYVILDDIAKGPVIIRTTQPVQRSQLLPTLETVLEFYGLALVESGEMYNIMARESAARSGPRLGFGTGPRLAGQGFGIQVVPLKYITAEEMQKIIEPMAPPGSVLRADSTRNLLVLAGTQKQLEAMINTVDMFDVDLLKGMSFALFPLQFVAAETLAGELERVFGEVGEGAVSGLISFLPVKHLNSILVIAQQPEYLAKARGWIEQLDQSSDGSNRRIYVYYVENARAENLAQALTQIFADGEAAAPKPDQARIVAPGLVPAEIRSRESGVRTTQAGAPAGSATSPSSGATQRPAAAPSPTPKRGPATALASGIGLPENSSLRIIAEPALNALIVLATPQEYRMIEATLRQLDIVPLQVLIEASVYEVTLTDDLNYGIRWFLETGNHQLSINNLPAIAGAGAFSYVFSAANFVASLEALASLTDLKIVSSPEVMVLDNHTAVLQVGDQVPVATRSSIGVGDTNAPVVNEIQFRNTGVILRVTPRVNVGGLVTMEIEQEVSDVTPSDEPTVTPTIFQRSISSTVAVQSGESIALGGLISDSARAGQRGVPLLMHIPILGNLFRSNSDETRRTELLVLITPIVVQDQQEARKISNELRSRMGRVYRLIDSHRARQGLPALDPAVAPAPKTETPVE